MRFTNLVARATNDRGEDGPRSVIAGETGLAHAGAIINDQSGNVVVTHFLIWWVVFDSRCQNHETEQISSSRDGR